MKKFMHWMLVATLITAPAVWAAVSQDEAVALVKQAAAAYQQDKTKFMAELNKQNGPYHKGELYVFAYDMKGTVIGNPAKPDLVGKNQYDSPDVDGKQFRKEIVDNAKSGKSGWVKYRTKNPSSGAVENKIAFYQPAGDIVLAAGTFEKQ